MKIALIQQHASMNKEDNISRGAEAVQQAAQKGADLAAFAELGFLPFLPQKPAEQDSQFWAETIPGPTTDVFSKLARKHRMVIVLNLFEEDNGRTYDSSPVIDVDGSITGVTRMVHVMDGLGFYEKGYYTQGENPVNVYETEKGRIGIAICYDRHFPEYMRQLGLQKADLVIVPQAGALNEWPPGIFEAELQVAAFQNGYYAALVNRVGKEEKLHFSGESFVVDPQGIILAQALLDKDDILFADCDFSRIPESPARRYFLRDRRPDFYKKFKK